MSLLRPEQISAFNDVLKSKAAFVRGQIEKGNTPSPLQMSQFLSRMQLELKVLVPFVGAAAGDVRLLIEGLGWHVSTNKPALGSVPPTAVAVLETLDACIVAVKVRYTDALPSLVSVIISVVS